ERIDIPAVPAKAVVDPTGCGDAYRAGLLSGIASGRDWRSTGQLASLMGSLKITARGGQNHWLDRDAIATEYRRHVGRDFWAPGRRDAGRQDADMAAARTARAAL